MREHNEIAIPVLRRFRWRHSRERRPYCCASASCRNERTDSRSAASGPPVHNDRDCGMRPKAVAAMLLRHAAQCPQGVLQTFCQRHEAFATEHNMGMLEAREYQPEVIEPMAKRLARDRDCKRRPRRTPDHWGAGNPSDLTACGGWIPRAKWDVNVAERALHLPSCRKTLCAVLKTGFRNAENLLDKHGLRSPAADENAGRRPGVPRCGQARKR